MGKENNPEHRQHLREIVCAKWVTIWRSKVWSTQEWTINIFDSITSSISKDANRNSQFPLWVAPAGNHGSYIHHLGLDVCFDEYYFHDSLRAHLIEGIGHCIESWICFFTFTGIPRTASSMEKFPRGTTTSAQDISCVYGISPSPPMGPQPKLPSPKRSRLRATSSQDSVGLRATQSDSSILSSSSDKAADLRPKVSAAWLDDVTVVGGDASVRSQSLKRPSSSPTSSQLRRSSVRLSVKNSLDGVCLETDGPAGKIN